MSTKLEIELRLNSKKEPVIDIIHHDKSSELEQLVLGVFISKAKNGLELVHLSGHLNTSNGESWERYQVTPNHEPLLQKMEARNKELVDFIKKTNQLLFDLNVSFRDRRYELSASQRGRIQQNYQQFNDLKLEQL